LPATPVFHIGLLVHDIEAAKLRLHRLLGIDFRQTQTFPVALEWGRERHETDVTFVYSVGGPPFVELIQTQENDGPFGRHNGEGLHHIAAWTADLEARLEAAAAAGAPADVRIFGEGAAPIAAYLPPDAAHGLRIELNWHSPQMPGYTPRLPGSAD
jgi:catechol 2,3-dioxygenase-like lactoylglutathione lyase family enzyme